MMEIAPSQAGSSLVCSVCHHPDSDLRLLGCGCTVHARCIPLSLVIDTASQQRLQQNGAVLPPANRCNATLCPICRSGRVTGIYMIPLSFSEIEKSIALRKEGADISTKSKKEHSRKHPRSGSPNSGLLAEATYLLLSSGHHHSLSNSRSVSDREQQRTGRWTGEEIHFVDFMLTAFDQGSLPLPHGIKLNEFLGDMLICKSSRLTKKMKNAKLSTRSFSISLPTSLEARNDCKLLSTLQEKFLESVSSMPTQLELRFNLKKQWRTHFSNLCVQVGYPFLDGKDWIASLEELESRATKAEEMVRRVRRKRLQRALRTDGGKSADPNVFIQGVQADNVVTQLLVQDGARMGSRTVSATDELSSTDTAEDGVSRMMDASFDENAMSSLDTKHLEEEAEGSLHRSRSFSEDFDAVLDDLLDPGEASIAKKPSLSPVPTRCLPPPLRIASPNHSCGAFLDALVHHMEQNRLPFQHADIWVPSFLPRVQIGPSKAVDTDQLRLFHAGHATRGDIGDNFGFQFREYAAYSEKFSFEPGHGLPGRVYTSGISHWETHLDEANPKHFERAGGAKVYGVKTAVGIALNTHLVGRIVVAIYSREHVPEQMSIANECVRVLSQLSPDPQWKLTMDARESNTDGRGFMNYSPAPTTSSHGSGSPVHSLPLLQSMIPSVSNDCSDQMVGCASPGSVTASRPSDVDLDEQRIIALLGEHVSSTERSSGETSSSASGDSKGLIHHFMSIRLLMLRHRSKRSVQQNEMVDILKSSFRAYTKDNRKNGAELAKRLADDWMYLKDSYAPAFVKVDIPAKKQRSPRVRQQSSSHLFHTQGGSTVHMPTPSYSSTTATMSAQAVLAVNPPTASFVSLALRPSPPSFLGTMSSSTASNTNTQDQSYTNGSYRRDSISSMPSVHHPQPIDESPQAVKPQSIPSSGSGVSPSSKPFAAPPPNFVGLG